MATSAFSAQSRAKINAQVKANVFLLDNAGSGVKIHLFTNDISPDGDTVLGDLVESAATGYAAVVIAAPTVSLAVNSDGQNVSAITDDVSYTYTSGSTANETIYGWYITNTAHSDSLVYVKTLDNPVVISNDGQILQINPELSLSNDMGGN